jgi:hypothetical protein
MKRIINMKKIICWLLGVIFSLNVNAGLIDFESTASGATPTDNGIIDLTDIFMADGVSVQFGFDIDKDGTLDTEAVFEQAGNTDAGEDTGFWGISKARDVAAPGFTSLLGDFFLRQYDPYQPFGYFIILYDADNAVTEASGEIWDIDGKPSKTEQFLVEAFNGSTLLDSISSPLGIDNSLNGEPWAFGFSGLSDITKIRISFTGSKTQGIGLAFNNFSPVEDISLSVNVSEPLTFTMFALGLVGILLRRF